MLVAIRCLQGSRTQALAVVLWAIAGLTVRQTFAQPLSEVIASGIGQKYLSSGGPVNYDRWPTPLRESPLAMMTVAISPDGSLVATGCGHPNQPGELVLWDAATGRERWVRRFPRGIRSVQFTADGKRLATGSFDGFARLVEVGSGKQLTQFAGHTDAINAVALSADDRWLATGSHDRTVILWNVADGSQVRTFRGHSDDVLTVAIAGDGKLLASAGRDNTVRIWNLETGEALRMLAGHEALVEMVAFSPDSSRLASTGGDSTLRLWDVKSGQQTAILARGSRCTSLSFAPKGPEIYSGAFDGQVAVWDPADEQAARQFPAQGGAVYAIAFSADGSRLATCGFEGSARLWKPDGTLLARFDRRRTLPDEAREIISAAWSPDERTLATLHADGAVRLTRAADGAAAGELAIPGDKITGAIFAGQGLAIIVGTGGGGVYRWDPLAKGEAPAEIAALSAPISALTLSPNRKLLVACGSDGSIWSHDLAAEKTLARFKSQSPAQCAALDSPGSRLATGHADGVIRWWDAASGRALGGELHLKQPVRALAIALSDRWLAAAAGPSVELWSLTFDDDKVQTAGHRALTVPEGQITQLAMSTQAEQIITGDTGGQVRLWGLSGGAARTLARQHGGGVVALALARRSQALLTAGADREAWLWQPMAVRQEIRPLASIPAHDQGTRYVALAKDQRLVSDGYDNHTRVWNLASGRMERDLAVPDGTSACVLLSGGTRVAVGHWNKRIQLVDLASGQKQINVRGLPRGPYAIDLNSTEDRMAVAYRELGAMVYDLKSDEADPVITLPPDELPFTHVAFSPDGKTFVTCTGDYKRMTIPGRLRLHDSQDGKVLRSFDGHTSEVKMAAFDSQGKRLATASGDKTVRVWEVGTGKLLATLPHAIGTFAALFVPDSNLLFTADYHGKVFLWDLSRSAVVQELTCHADFVSQLSLSEDMSVLASGSRDGTVKLWKLSGAGDALRIVDGAARSSKEEDAQ